ncbi:hypothetical protein DRO60_01710 [Candidatus Bathyarchaeota archaeon]|nr:MAG: hypothetical protein DRO60_01710 [Candidatus Bathyarchaeota archaeon]
MMAPTGRPLDILGTWAATPLATNALALARALGMAQRRGEAAASDKVFPGHHRRYDLHRNTRKLVSTPLSPDIRLL